MDLRTTEQDQTPIPTCWDEISSPKYEACVGIRMTQMPMVLL